MRGQRLEHHHGAKRSRWRRSGWAERRAATARRHGIGQPCLASAQTLFPLLPSRLLRVQAATHIRPQNCANNESRVHSGSNSAASPLSPRHQLACRPTARTHDIPRSHSSAGDTHRLSGLIFLNHVALHSLFQGKNEPQLPQRSGRPRGSRDAKCVMT